MPHKVLGQSWRCLGKDREAAFKKYGKRYNSEMPRYVKYGDTNMKKRPADYDSDEFDVDEPEEFEESGSDWEPDEEEGGGNKKRKGKGKLVGSKSARNKKKKIEKPPTEDEEEEEEEEEEENEEENEEEEDLEEEEESEEEEGPKEGETTKPTTIPIISVKAFTNGSFVVLKTDFLSGGNHPLWKVDGKALLQKYIPFEKEGKTLYKNTSTYSGWTDKDRDLYAPVTVTYLQQGKRENIVEFDRAKVEIYNDKEDGKENETSDAKAGKVDA